MFLQRKPSAAHIAIVFAFSAGCSSYSATIVQQDAGAGASATVGRHSPTGGSNSGGTTVLVSLGRIGDHLVLSIEDNGTGIKKQKVADEDEEKTGGMGLKIMKYRTEIIDGTFQVQKNRPTGTIITVKIPIEILKDEGRIFYGGRYAQKQ